MFTKVPFEEFKELYDKSYSNKLNKKIIKLIPADKEKPLEGRVYICDMYVDDFYVKASHPNQPYNIIRNGESVRFSKLIPEYIQKAKWLLEELKLLEDVPVSQLPKNTAEQIIEIHGISWHSHREKNIMEGIAATGSWDYGDKTGILHFLLKVNFKHQSFDFLTETQDGGVKLIKRCAHLLQVRQLAAELLLVEEGSYYKKEACNKVEYEYLNRPRGG